MTDIRHHLKGIRKILYTTLVDSEHYEAIDHGLILSTIRKYLPASYGIGSGVLVHGSATSEPMDIILYDVPLAGGEYPEGTTEYPIETALLTLNFAATITLAEFAEIIRKVASVKRLTQLRPLEPRPVDDKPIGQARRMIPKDRLPFALLYFDRLEDSENVFVDVINIMRKYDTAPLVWPDQIDVIGQQAQFLNPMLERFPSTIYDLGWSRTPNLRKPDICYACKERYLRPHFFYDRLCMRCGDLNYSKRIQTANLSRHRVLVTGARVKIGYAAALRLLRAGAEVIITTRFPRDAARRYAEEPDFDQWRERLHIYGLDLRQGAQLERFITHLEATYPHLDAIINNAAQTVKRPPQYYAHLLPLETGPIETLPDNTRALLAGDVNSTDHLQPSIAGLLPGGPDDPDFPKDQVDEHGQQVDNRDFNSWIMRLEDVSPAEIAEVHLVNAIAPAILTGQLKPMLRRSPKALRFVINVSAAEGRFNQHKNGYHPHTNMAKAALNMLTRSIAEDYAADRVYVISVDPGWVSDQVPRTGDHSRVAANEKIPIDMIDAAARVCDPIFSNANHQHIEHGVLLKDYRVTEW